MSERQSDTMRFKQDLDEHITRSDEALRSEPKQETLFEKGKWWDEHWKGMPEFEQKNQAPYKTLYVHFESPKDVEEFSKLVGQRILESTKFIWYPEADIGSYFNKSYVDAMLNDSEEDSTEIIDSE